MIFNCLNSRSYNILMLNTYEICAVLVLTLRVISLIFNCLIWVYSRSSSGKNYWSLISGAAMANSTTFCHKMYR
jgi:hypothetical protein